MTVPPNRIGGLRGSGGATLDDLLAELTQIKQATLAMKTTTDNMLIRLNWLVGTTAPPATTFGASLYAYLVRVLGPQNQISVAGSGDMIDLLNLIGTNSVTLLNYLSGAPDPQISVNLIKNIADDVLSSEGLLRELRNDLVQNPGTSEPGFTTKLLAAIGEIGTTPANMTVRELLEAIRLCSCEGQNGTAFPPPTTGCLDSPPAWQECNLTKWVTVNASGSTPALDIYRVEWPATITGDVEYGLSNVGGILSGENNCALTYTGVLDTVSRVRNICIAWNFPAPFYNYDGIVQPVTDSPFASYTGTATPVPAQDTRAFTNAVLTTPDTRRGLFVNFAVEANQPIGKVYVQFGA